MSLWHAIGGQLRHPRGIGGWLAGHAMRIANRGPNALAVNALEIIPTDDILELGFGPGEAIELMVGLAPYGRICGIDQSALMFQKARERNAAAIRAGRVDLKHARFEDLPLDDESVDKILAVNVIYFWGDPVGVLKEAGRVLRPGGLIAIYATDASAMRRWRFAGPETHRLYDADRLAAILRQAGFAAEEIDVAPIRATLGIPGLIAKVRKNTDRQRGDL